MKGSDVADHCCRFALSDGTKDYSSSCDHPHSNSCKQCEDLEVVLDSLKETSNNLEYENDDQRDDTNYIVSESVRAVQEWKKHVLRTVNQDMARKTVVESLKGNEVLIERDWAMKFIPMQYRESQASWFGKRGLNWHITVATFKIESGITSHTIIHIFDSATQDAETSNAIQSNCFDILSSMKPCLDIAFIRSDNAGCFHGSVSVCAAPYLSSHIFCARMDFADPQGGKSICDRKAAHTKSYIRRYVNEGNDVCTASDFKDAVMKMKMKNVTVIVALPPTKSASKKQGTVFKLPKITTLNNFCFTEEGYVRVWRQYDIGEGCTIPATGSCSVDSLPKITVMETYVNRQQFEIEVEGNQDDVNFRPNETDLPQSDVDFSQPSIDVASPLSNVNISQYDVEISESEEVTRDMSRLFTCSECTKTFRRHGNLLRHLDNGSHDHKVENHCLADKAKIEYFKQMEKVNILAANLQNCTAGRSQNQLKRGWALKSRREVKRFNKNQTDFLAEKFDKGEKTGQKCDPEDVSQDMRQVKGENGRKRFLQEEFLSAQQIASYFSRLVLKKRQSYNSMFTEEDLQAEMDTNEFQELNDIVA